MRMLELKIRTNDRLIMLQHITPLIQQALAENIISHFHFFSEPWANIAIRFKVNEEERLKALFAGIGEWEDFDKWQEGNDWYPFWEVNLAFLQSVATFALALVTHPERPRILTAGKIVHCLLNTMGYTRQDEIQAYKEWHKMSKLILKLYKKGKIERNRKIEIPPRKGRGLLNI